MDVKRAEDIAKMDAKRAEEIAKMDAKRAEVVALLEKVRKPAAKKQKQKTMTYFAASLEEYRERFLIVYERIWGGVVYAKTNTREGFYFLAKRPEGRGKLYPANAVDPAVDIADPDEFSSTIERFGMVTIGNKPSKTATLPWNDAPGLSVAVLHEMTQTTNWAFENDETESVVRDLGVTPAAILSKLTVYLEFAVVPIRAIGSTTDDCALWVRGSFRNVAFTGRGFSIAPVIPPTGTPARVMATVTGAGYVALSGTKTQRYVDMVGEVTGPLTVDDALRGSTGTRVNEVNGDVYQYEKLRGGDGRCFVFFRDARVLSAGDVPVDLAGTLTTYAHNQNAAS